MKNAPQEIKDRVARVRRGLDMRPKPGETEEAHRLRVENLRRLETPAEQPPAIDPVAVEPAQEPVMQQEPVIDQPAQPQVEQPAILELQEQLRKLNDRFAWAEGTIRRQNEQAAEQRAAHEQQVAALQAEIAERDRRIQETKVQQERSRPVSDEDIKRWFTPEQIKTFGVDGCKELAGSMRAMHAEIGRAEVQAEVAALRNEVQQDREQAQKMRADAFNSAVTALCPDWLTIDGKTEFRQWLGTIDPISGETYRDLGVKAKQALDHKRFVAVYLKYKESLPPSPAAPQRGMLPTGRPSSEPRTDVQEKPGVTKQELVDFNRRYAQDRKFRQTTARDSAKQKIADLMARGAKMV